MSTNFILLQEQAGGGLGNIIMMILLIVIFYFFFIVQPRKQRKKVEAAQDALQSGDKVITQGGIIGKVKSVKGATINIEVSNNVCITVAKDRVYPYVEPEQKDK